jgi:hypothetical protein
MHASSEAPGLMRPSPRVPDPGPEWAALPTSRSARWFLPRRPGVLTNRSFLIHHPVTIRSRVGWEAGRFLATRGGLQLLRSSAMLPREVWDPVADLIPAGGALSVARANHPGRYFAVVIGAGGDLQAFVKVARDSRGDDSLQREREALETFGPLLPAPLFAPRVLDSGEGLLVLEAVEWRTRLDPWRLPGEVARALGGFFRATASGSDGSLGITHGDCTPWNLLRTAKGWALVDWESTEGGVPPFFDPFHYLVQSCVELRRPTKRAVVEGLNLRGWVGRSLSAYAEGAGLDPGMAKGLFEEYLRYSAGRVSPSAPPRALGMRRKLLRLFRSHAGASA